jgi:hypothetical protein
MGFGSRFRLATLLGTAVLIMLAVGGIAVAGGLHQRSHRIFHGKRSALSAAEVRRLSSGAGHRSIIIFRNQLSNLPARRANARMRANAIAAVQSSVRTELARVHARRHLGTGGADDGSIPIVVRSLVSLGAGGGSFSGRLTGGGDVGLGGQTFTYQFRIPRGQPELNLGVQLADPNYQLLGFLTDPNGEPLDIQSTTTFDATDAPIGFGPTMQFFRASPSAGLWTLTLLVAGPVDGTHLSEPFQGTISFAAPQVTATGIPNSRRAVLRRGRPVTATIQITNTGNSRKDFFVDPRLDQRVPQPLLGDAATNVPLPLSISALPPNWLVPPGTNALTVAAQGNVPLTLEVGAQFGDPDVEGPSFGNSSLATLRAPEVAPGFFNGLPEPLGPFGAGPITGATVNLAAVANTYVFDPDVSSSSGDGWAQSIDPNASYTPVSIAPGGSGTIQLTITPSGRRGRVVHGVIGVDTLRPDTSSGDEVQMIPYTYRIGGRR